MQFIIHTHSQPWEVDTVYVPRRVTRVAHRDRGTYGRLQEAGLGAGDAWFHRSVGLPYLSHSPGWQGTDPHC